MRVLVPKPRRLVSIASLTQSHTYVEELSSQWWINNQHNTNNTSVVVQQQHLYIKKSDPIPIATTTLNNSNEFIPTPSSISMSC